MARETTRRVDGLTVINTSNVFAALERKSRKNRSAKDKNSPKSEGPEKKPEKLWTPPILTITSWADCEDDDDYFASAPPPISVWSTDEAAGTPDQPDQGLSEDEESESDDDVEVEAEGEVEEELKNVAELEDLRVTIPATVLTVAVRKQEKQLSKKELKKKELDELDAVLMELGISKTHENGIDETGEDKNHEVPDGEQNGEERKGGGLVITESKIAKRRKAKKEKSVKEGKDDDPSTKEAEPSTREAKEEDKNATITDLKDKLRKLTSSKKKKSLKEIDLAARAEAAARTAKLAAAKKREKNHYNQKPVR